MRIFIASFGTETNVFSPLPTGRQDFIDTYFFRDDALSRPPMMFGSPLHVWNKRAQSEGHEIICSISTFAQPAGRTVRHVYEEFRDMILDDLKSAGPVDIVLYSMHGAMQAEGYDDCEGDLLARTRALVGSKVVIGAEFDLHGHLTDEMMAAADLLIFFKHYPHDDIDDRADELYSLATATARGDVKPVMRYWDCKMMGLYMTPLEPMASFVAEMKAEEEKPGVLSLSLNHGFPFGDMAEMGTRMLAITDDDPDLADRLANDFGQKIWDLRENFRTNFISVDEALDYARVTNKLPLVLADTADNAGGGSPADATFMLQGVLERGLSDVVMGIFWDPGVVKICQSAGEGAELDLCLGGKHGPASGLPVNIRAKVMRISEGLRHALGDAEESETTLGITVWLQLENNVNLLVNTIRTQVFSRKPFLEIGIDLSAMRTIIVKSTNHFYNSFVPVGQEIRHVATPGAMQMDLTRIAYQNRDDNFWPKVENPHTK
jgi:microcystin degradation protein MlrC